MSKEENLSLRKEEADAGEFWGKPAQWAPHGYPFGSNNENIHHLLNFSPILVFFFFFLNLLTHIIFQGLGVNWKSFSFYRHLCSWALPKSGPPGTQKKAEVILKFKTNKKNLQAVIESSNRTSRRGVPETKTILDAHSLPLKRNCFAC